MTIAEAVKKGVAVVLCPRCGWWLAYCKPAVMEDRCPDCREFGLDAVEPGSGGPS